MKPPSHHQTPSTAKVFVALLFAASAALAGSHAKEPQPLDLCTLIANWQQFSGKTLRVTALFREGAEQSVLSDPACGKRDLVAVSPRAHVAGKVGRLRRILRRNRQAEVVLEGVFRGPELAPIDPKLPEFIKEKLKGSRLRYGHLGSFDMELELTKVIGVRDAGKE